MKVNKSGLQGEIYAARYMRDNGYKMMTQNFRCRFGELDVVGLKDGYLCIVEVKTRTEGALAEPKEAVDREKQEKIIAATKYYMNLHEYTYQPRFDVCEVLIDESRKLISLNYIENAFGG